MKWTDVWKVNGSDFLNEEVEEFTSRSSQNLVKLRGRNKSDIQFLFHTWWYVVTLN